MADRIKITNRNGMNYLILNVVAERGTLTGKLAKGKEKSLTKTSHHNWSQHGSSFLLYDSVF